MSLTVLQQGVQSIPVDMGRRHLQHLGVTVGGPMDLHAYLWNNFLLGNGHQSAQLEICHGHFSGSFSQPTTIAITGADMNPQLNGEPIGMWQSHRVKAGDQLLFKAPRNGLYAYLGVHNGFEIKPHLGSVCAVPRDGLGGLNHDGAVIKAGDQIGYTSASLSMPKAIKRTPPQFVPDYAKELRLGVIESYQHQVFSDPMRALFYQQEYCVSTKINRQGVCLQGQAIGYAGPELISEGIANGAIQIPPDGQPIVLMRDRQSIGGYPKMGCVSALDVGRLAQCRPGAKIRFAAKDLAKVQADYQALLEFFTQS